MKTFFLITSLTLATSFLSVGGAFSADGPTNRVVLFATNYLLKLYHGNDKKEKQVSVPEVSGYTLQQVAVINEIRNSAGSQEFEYVAVYKQNGTPELMVVLYNNRNEEQISLSPVRKVAFEADHAVTRILMQKTGPGGQPVSEALLVPGTLQVAQKG